MKYLRIISLLFMLSMHSVYAYDNIIEVKDEQSVWQEKTEIDIFENKLIAPGSHNTYTFQIKNVSDNKVNCTLKPTLNIYPDNLFLPIQVRLKCNDKWILGNNESYVPITSVLDVNESIMLLSKEYHSYTLETDWPFEENDVYDTYLGNFKEDITLSLSFDVQASENISVSTGDRHSLMIYIILMFLSLSILYFLKQTKS